MRLPDGTRPSGGARVGCRFGIEVVAVSEGAMRARYCVGGAESLGDEQTAGRRRQIVQARWEHRDVAPAITRVARVGRLFAVESDRATPPAALLRSRDQRQRS
jgi:hypothetical protein